MGDRIRLVLSLAASAAAFACGGAGGPTGPTPAVPGPTPSPTPAPTPAAPTARYEVTFESSWSAATHPTDFPSNAHFSRLIGGTHSARARFWAAGGIASPGIEAMAEEGRTSPLDSEVQAAIAAGAAYSLIQGGAIARSPGVATAAFEISRDHPLVSLVSMVAPSPDWYVGVDGLSLVEGGDWVDQKTVSLHPWDAGTDGGATYNSPDQDTQPRQRIRALDGQPVAWEGAVAPFGTFTFRRLN